MSEDGESGSDQSVMRLLLQYLIEHPDAKDTRDGIQKWWLPKGHTDHSRQELQSALNLLTYKGWLTKRGKTPSEEIYGMSKERLEEIKDFLLPGQIP